MNLKKFKLVIPTLAITAGLLLPTLSIGASSKMAMQPMSYKPHVVKPVYTSKKQPKKPAYSCKMMKRPQAKRFNYAKMANKAKIRSKNLVAAGKINEQKEETLRIDTSKKGNVGNLKGKEISAKPIHNLKPMTKMPLMKTVGGLRMQKRELYKRPVKIRARKPMFNLPGVGNKTVKAMTFDIKKFRPSKVNYNKLKDLKIRKYRAHQMKLASPKVAINTNISQGYVAKPIPVQLQQIKYPEISIIEVEADGRGIVHYNNTHEIKSIPKSSKGKWISFYVTVKNNGDGPAYRMDVIGEHNGREWPSKDNHIVKLRPKQQKTVIVKMLVPQTAAIRSNHRISLFVDKNRVNKDKKPNNNQKTVAFAVTPPVEPDLYFKKFERQKIESWRHWPGIRRGKIKYDYNITIGNKGNKSSTPTGLGFKVQKIDSWDNNPAVWLYRNWSYHIPTLAPGGSHDIDTNNWKVYVGQKERVDAVIDPGQTITEPKGNNTRWGGITVSYSSPFSGTWLGDLFGNIGDFFVAVGGALYDGATWTFKQIKAASQAALAAVLWPEMMLWVETNFAIHRPQARAFNAREKAMLKDYFPTSLINSTQIQIVDSWTQPELWGDAAGVTYGEEASGYSVIVIERGHYSDGILIHEMVHAYQYKDMRLHGFSWEYIYSWVKAGFSYRDISLEKQAYGFVKEAYTNGHTQQVSNYLGY